MVYNRASTRPSVNKSIFLALFGTILVALGTLSPALSAAQSNTGSVTYTITLNTPSGTKSYSVNETVQSTHKAGFSELFIQVSGGEANLTYSRLVNASANFLPYLPTLANESFSLSRTVQNYTIRFSVTGNGTRTTTFQGKTYEMKVYTIRFSVTSAYQSHSGTGSITIFPSGLVYSATVSIDGTYSFQALLKAASNPLADPPTQTPVLGYAAAGVGVVAVALVASAIVRQRRRRVQPQESKPLHWVD
jgi:hypothetical protein